MEQILHPDLTIGIQNDELFNIRNLFNYFYFKFTPFNQN